ncbi:unnamed protein product, partial [Ectocarpus sp. 12 AP-2014]
ALVLWFRVTTSTLSSPTGGDECVSLRRPNSPLKTQEGAAEHAVTSALMVVTELASSHLPGYFQTTASCSKRGSSIYFPPSYRAAASPQAA